jgi:hypothetical protein
MVFYIGTDNNLKHTLNSKYNVVLGNDLCPVMVRGNIVLCTDNHMYYLDINLFSKSNSNLRYLHDDNNVVADNNYAYIIVPIRVNFSQTNIIFSHTDKFNNEFALISGRYYRLHCCASETVNSQLVNLEDIRDIDNIYYDRHNNCYTYINTGNQLINYYVNDNDATIIDSDVDTIISFAIHRQYIYSKSNSVVVNAVEPYNKFYSYPISFAIKKAKNGFMLDTNGNVWFSVHGTYARGNPSLYNFSDDNNKCVNLTSIGNNTYALLNDANICLCEFYKKPLLIANGTFETNKN